MPKLIPRRRRHVRIGFVVAVLALAPIPFAAAATSGAPSAAGASSGPEPTGRSEPAAGPRLTSDLPLLVGYQLPVSGPTRVVVAFDAPADQYGPGHRGVDLATEQRGPVLAAGRGTVRFTGLVAGRPLVVIAHQDGIVTEYEPVVASVHTGQEVVGGQTIGRLVGSHARCEAVSCLHWGARRGDAYIDPMSLLRRLGVVRLIE